MVCVDELRERDAGWNIDLEVPPRADSTYLLKGRTSFVEAYASAATGNSLVRMIHSAMTSTILV